MLEIAITFIKGAVEPAMSQVPLQLLEEHVLSNQAESIRISRIEFDTK